MKSESKPNIILIMTDQHRADYLGCYGHPVVQTPNIDSMAERGVRFDRFYVSSPVCMPNRATFMTGRMPSLHGVRMNGIPLSFRQVTFVEALADSGYRTALVGKSHLQNFTGSNPTMKRRKVFPNHRELPKALSEAQRDNFDDPIYQQENPKSWTRDFSVDLPYYGFQHVELAPAHGDAAAGDHLRWMLKKDPDALNLVGRENQLHHDYICPQAVRTALPEELYSTNYVAERSVAYLEEHVRSASSDPFFLNVSFPDPHHPFNPPGKYWGMYDPDDMETPTAFEESNWTPPPHVQSVMDERKSGKANLNGMAAINCNEREAREASALTCGMITCIDDAVGKILQKLKDLNLDDNTIVIFTADHGEHLGDHQLLFKGAAHYQSILRVPFIWSDPEASEPGRAIARIGSTLDIASTILDRAGVEPYNGIQGQSLLPEIENTSAIGPDESCVLVQYEHQKPDEAMSGPPIVHTLVTSKWRLSVFDGVTWGELYDLETDPEELRNVWGDTEYSAIKSELTEQLLRKEISYIEKSPLPTARA